MTEYGDVAEEDSLLQDGMIFRLDPREIAKKDEAPMWASASSPSDWFFTDDDHEITISGKSGRHGLQNQ